MNGSILNIEIQEFINNNLNSDTTTLLFKRSPFSNVDIKVLVEQIEAKKKCKDKLPTWFNHSNILYPNKLNIEQTSSEITAEYKSNLVEGNSLIDITGGFGVDAYYFSKRIGSIQYCELNAELSQIATNNFEQLEVNNISTHAIDGIEFLKNTSLTFDWIYADPSRRHDLKGKVFLLEDCLPNIPEHLDFLFTKAKNILIKTSPLLDITNGINALAYVQTIHCVAVNNEVKELLWVLTKEYEGSITINTTNIVKLGNQNFSFTLLEEKTAIPKFSIPQKYLYEPNPSILKAGGFNSIATKLGLNKLHQHSHLYTSNELHRRFPGRIFVIQEILPFSKKGMQQLRLQKANITTRNFPETVAAIRKKYQIQDGGDSYLFFTTTQGGKIIIKGKKEIK